MKQENIMINGLTTDFGTPLTAPPADWRFYHDNIYFANWHNMGYRHGWSVVVATKMPVIVLLALTLLF